MGPGLEGLEQPPVGPCPLTPPSPPAGLCPRRPGLGRRLSPLPPRLPPAGGSGRGVGWRLRDPRLERDPQRGGGGGGGRPPVEGGRCLQRGLGGRRAALPRSPAGAGPRHRHLPGGVRRLRQHRGAGAGRSPASPPRSLGGERHPEGRGGPPGVGTTSRREEEEERRAGTLLPAAPRGGAPRPAARCLGGRGGTRGFDHDADVLVHERVPHRLLHGPPGRPSRGC